MGRYLGEGEQTDRRFLFHTNDNRELRITPEELARTCGESGRRICDERIHYVSFPPVPALVFLPLVAIWGYDTNDVLVTVLVGGLNAVLLFWFLRAARPAWALAPLDARQRLAHARVRVRHRGLLLERARRGVVHGARLRRRAQPRLHAGGARSAPPARGRAHARARVRHAHAHPLLRRLLRVAALLPGQSLVPRGHGGRRAPRGLEARRRAGGALRRAARGRPARARPLQRRALRRPGRVRARLPDGRRRRSRARPRHVQLHVPQPQPALGARRDAAPHQPSRRTCWCRTTGSACS